MKEFKLIVAGGRDYADRARLEAEVMALAEEIGTKGFDQVSIVSGMARGADRLAYEFARANNVQCYEFPADWDRYGKSAGYLRNVEMARFSDGLLAFWDGQSKGTGHMITIMQRMNKPVTVINY